MAVAALLDGAERQAIAEYVLHQHRGGHRQGAVVVHLAVQLVETLLERGHCSWERSWNEGTARGNVTGTSRASADTEGEDGGGGVG